MGTQSMAPISPKRRAPNSTAIITHNPDMPTAFPTTLGYMRLPSICCMASTNTMNHRARGGSTTNIMERPIAPDTQGPTMGTIWEAPTITLISTAKGKPSICIPRKHIMPSMKHSMSIPYT